MASPSSLRRSVASSLAVILLATLSSLAAVPADIVLLRTPASERNWTADATLWRYHETWQTDMARLESGKLVRVDPLNPRIGFSSAKIWQEQQSGRNPRDLQFPVREATRIVGSPFPPAGWTSVDFDDGDWLRNATVMGNHYRSLALVCLRGKFQVADPIAVTRVQLQASIQGGAVVYLNGSEIGRIGLPQGKLAMDTLADDYDKDAYVGRPGCLLPHRDGGGMIMPEKEFYQREKDTQLHERYRKRFRSLNVTIAPASLRKGTNVLAIEIHRAQRTR